MRPPPLILCDFDGTIATVDVSDLLLTRFAEPGWLMLESDWAAGRIGSAQCMQGQFALVDASEEEFDALVDSVEIDPDFGRFVSLAESLGCRLEVVSDGADRAIRRILGRAGLQRLPVFANRLQPVGKRRWRLDSPHRAADCGAGTCKCERAELGDGLALLIGDGASDFCVAGRVDHVFAKSRLIGHCDSHGFSHDEIANFAEACEALPRWLAAAEASAAACA